MKLSHVSPENRPTMVDVGGKPATQRSARAQAIVVFPTELLQAGGQELKSKKGPVIDTAIIAGVMAAKRTHELIPFCHPIPLDDCQISAHWNEERELVLECAVRATHRTGVEMEALTGVSVAALTVYDMCKALGHGIRIGEIRLLTKTGGKRDYSAT